MVKRTLIKRNVNTAGSGGDKDYTLCTIDPINKDNVGQEWWSNVAY